MNKTKLKKSAYSEGEVIELELEGKEEGGDRIPVGSGRRSGGNRCGERERKQTPPA